MVKRAPGKDRGVFAREDIKKGTEIECVPVLVLKVKALYDNEYDSCILNYVFDWGKNTVALALGYGLLTTTASNPTPIIQPGLLIWTHHFSARRWTWLACARIFSCGMTRVTIRRLRRTYRLKHLDRSTKADCE